MAIKRVYKNTLLDSQYLFRNGKSAHFVGGRYLTDVKEEIEELDNEIRNGIPHIYVDPEDTVVDTGKEDFVAQRQREATIAAIREYEAQQSKGAVTGNLVADPKTGLPNVPGASEEQQAAHTDTPQTEVKTGTAEVKNAEAPAAAPSSLATLLAARTAAPASTGIATTDNAPKA